MFPQLFSDISDKATEKCILPLSSSNHKGSSGRVAVLGGSARYTGAPYYAAMASLKAGADLCYVFTAQEAALPIKCYSPELMVAPVYSATAFDQVVADGLLDSDKAEQLVDDMVQQVVESMQRLHCLVIGPGLGRCPLVMKAVSMIILKARELNLHLVLDADALYMLSLTEYRNILAGYDKVVLTPNVVEYKRLFEGKSVEGDDTSSFASAVIVQKGATDIIYGSGEKQFVCGEQGGLKRSGGLGDVLAGTLGTLTAWHVILMQRGVSAPADWPMSCWTACCFTRRATKKAFTSKHRAMTAPDVLEALGPSINEMVTEP